MFDEEALKTPEEASLTPDEIGSEEIDIVALQTALEEERKKAERYLSNWQRSEADFANIKKRNEQERNEFIKFATGNIICDLLPVLDDLERALTSAPPEIAESQWINGINLIQRKLVTTLENQGILEIKARGELFDPRYHEAVAQCPGKDGQVVDVTRKGYQLHDRVLRPVSVMVGNGKE